MPRARTVLLAGGAALLVRRSLRRKVSASPLWPMPALEEPTSGTGRYGAGRGGARAGLRLTVAERTEPAEGVVRLRLVATDGRALPAWEPGAHIDVVLPSGTVRQYSLCGDPADRAAYTIATRRIPAAEGGRGGSREVHELLDEGAELTVRGPRNRFPLSAVPGCLFLAGGIGITPILPMVRAAEAAGTPWRLVYAGRTRASMPFTEELEEHGERVTVVPQDVHGHPDLAAALAGVPQDWAVYCCGPEGLMETVTALYDGGGPQVPGGGLHMERFTASGTASGDDRAFEVELRRSGRTVAIPADRTTLQAVREAQPGTPYSCEQGFCGTCRTRVLAGEPDHRDELLTDAEREESMLLCVSRSRGGRLVLDL